MQYIKESRKAVRTIIEQIGMRPYFLAQLLSQMRVARESTSAKAELRPRRASVKKNRTDQTLDPGISASARGYVKKPIVKVERVTGMFSGVKPRKPMTPKTAKPATISYRELQQAIIRAS